MVKSMEFYKQHTRELHLIKLIVKENRETLEFLMKSGTKQGNLHNPPEENDIIKLITPLLPIKTDEDVKNLESIIDENELNMQILVKDLSLLGGSTTKELVRRIMYHTFSNNVGALYSYEGQKGKKVFKTLLLQTTILKAVRRQFNEATDLEIVNGIKSWLVAAKFRGKKWKLLQLTESLECDYLIILRQNILDQMQASGAYLRMPQALEKINKPQQEISKLLAQLSSIKEKFDWQMLPAELRPKAVARRMKIKESKSVDVDTRLNQLEKQENNSVEAMDVTVKEEGEVPEEEEEPIENYEDEDIDDGTDYANNYFDNGEAYEDEEDNLDDGPIY